MLLDYLEGHEAHAGLSSALCVDKEENIEVDEVALHGRFGFLMDQVLLLVGGLHIIKINKVIL